MNILKTFNIVNTTNSFKDINIKGTIEAPLFDFYDIINLIELKDSNEIINLLDKNEKVLLNNKLFLNEEGLYRVLLFSDNNITNLFQEWFFNSLKEIRLQGIYKLNTTNIIDKKIMDYKSQILFHQKSIDKYNLKNVFYLCLLNEGFNKNIIKIGITNNINDKINNLKESYDTIEPLLLFIAEINDNIFIETLKNNNNLKKFYIPYKNINNTISDETYSVNKEELNEILKIIYENIKINLKLENEKLSIKLEQLILKEKEINLEIKKNNDSDSEIDITTCYSQIKNIKKGNRSPKVYQYNPDNLNEPINIFDSPIDVEKTIDGISPSSLKNAAKNNTIYKSYRWLFIQRNVEPPKSISETVFNKHKSPEVRFLAMIDIKQTKILEVFSNQKQAVEARNMKSNGFTRAIKECSISSGHYWKYFDDCSEIMKKEFLSHSSLPEKYIPKSGKIVQQIDPKTDEVIETYHSNRDVIKKFQMSVLSLKNASELGHIHNGYKWKII